MRQGRGVFFRFRPVGVWTMRRGAVRGTHPAIGFRARLTRRLGRGDSQCQRCRGIWRLEHIVNICEMSSDVCGLETPQPPIRPRCRGGTFPLNALCALVGRATSILFSHLLSHLFSEALPFPPTRSVEGEGGSLRSSETDGGRRAADA